jgi:uncharacterized protein YggE
MKRIAILSGLLLAAVALAGVLRPEGAKAVDDPVARDTVTVSGNGAVSSVPDRAAITAGVESRAPTAQAALEANAKAMQKVIEALRDSGGKKLTTSTVSLSPSLTQEGQPDGYVALNTVSAEFALGSAGAAIDAAVAAGANTVYGPTFTSSDRASLYSKALEAAVADAKAHAQTLATAAGRSLGEAITINESSSAPVPYYEKTAASDVGAPTPIVSGAQETTAMVSVTYELR